MNYYVYWHRDPKTMKIVYVGHGSKSRAWMYDQPFRDEDHAAFLSDLVSCGYLPDDWTIIISRQLSKEDACQLEREQIEIHQPIYNKIQGAKLLKVTPEIIEKACLLRELGLSYSDIAKEVNLSTMTIHRAMNKKVPALEAILARQNGEPELPFP